MKINVYRTNEDLRGRISENKIQPGYIIDRIENDEYFIVSQNYSSLPNWRCLKAIIIGSDNLPVVGEYLPITHETGFLTHYDEELYTNALKYAGFDKNDIRDMFKKIRRKS